MALAAALARSAPLGACEQAAIRRLAAAAAPAAVASSIR
jgi:hypothetical protein